MIDIIVTDNQGQVKRIIQRNEYTFDIYKILNSKWNYDETCSENEIKLYLSDVYSTVYKKIEDSRELKV